MAMGGVWGPSSRTSPTIQNRSSARKPSHEWQDATTNRLATIEMNPRPDKTTATQEADEDFRYPHPQPLGVQVHDINRSARTSLVINPNPTSRVRQKKGEVEPKRCRYKKLCRFVF
jgi:hypothetical protein